MKVAEQISIRELTVADYPRICELRNHTMTEPVTVEILLSRDANWPKEGIRERLVAVNGEEVLAYAQLVHWAGMPEGRFYLTIDVDPEHKRQGLGSALLAQLEARGDGHQAKRIMVAARDDRAEGRAFLEAHGYEYHQHLFDSEMDLTQFDMSGFQPLVDGLAASGVVFRQYTEIEDTGAHRRKLHEVHNDADADTPGIEEWGLSTFEDFEADVFKSPRYWPEGIFVAEADGEWIAISMVGPVAPDIYGTFFTGVRKGWRGRSIGLAAKALAIKAAAEAGGKVLRAQNDVTNKPMLAINEALGFKPQFGWVYFRKDR